MEHGDLVETQIDTATKALQDIGMAWPGFEPVTSSALMLNILLLCTCSSLHTTNLYISFVKRSRPVLHTCLFWMQLQVSGGVRSSSTADGSGIRSSSAACAASLSQFKLLKSAPSGPTAADSPDGRRFQWWHASARPGPGAVMLALA